MSNVQKVVVLCVVGGIILVGGFFVFSEYTYNEKPMEEGRSQQNLDSSMTVELPRENILESDYSKDAKRVYYQGTFVDSGDPQSFTVLTGDLEPLKGERVYTYAKDSMHAYYEGKQIDDADSATFEPIENGRWIHRYAKDKNSVYFKNSLILESDVDTFEILWLQAYEGCRTGYLYAKDKKNVFFEDQLVEGADPMTFEVFISGYGKDSKGVYKDGVFQEGVDPSTFVEPECTYG